MKSSLKVFSDYKDFDDHKIISFFSDKNLKLNGFIAIHRCNSNHPSFGATRLWNYPNTESALIDVLRLSKTMSKKAALAGLKCGGAKAVILSRGDISDRRSFFEAYAKKVNLFNGNFITGSDVGVSPDDVKNMKKVSPYIVGVKTDPVKYTVMGLLISIKTCLNDIYGDESLVNRSFAVQGLGKIGSGLIKLLYPFAKHLYVADIYNPAVKELVKTYPKLIVVKYGDIHKQNVDVFSPCAMSNSLNRTTVKELKCKLVIGGANNQLEFDELSEELHKKNIIYTPDYLVNAGGLISVYDEYEFKNTNDARVIKKLNIIKTNLRLILTKSKSNKITPLEVANRMAINYYNTII